MRIRYTTEYMMIAWPFSNVHCLRYTLHTQYHYNCSFSNCIKSLTMLSLLTLSYPNLSGFLLSAALLVLYLLSCSGGLQFSKFTGDRDVVELLPESSRSCRKVLPGWMVRSPASVEHIDCLLVVFVVAGVKNAVELSLSSLSDTAVGLGDGLTGDGLLNLGLRT